MMCETVLLLSSNAGDSAAPSLFTLDASTTTVAEYAKDMGALLRYIHPCDMAVPSHQAQPHHCLAHNIAKLYLASCVCMYVCMYDVSAECTGCVGINRGDRGREARAGDRRPRERAVRPRCVHIPSELWKHTSYRCRQLGRGQATVRAERSSAGQGQFPQAPAPMVRAYRVPLWSEIYGTFYIFMFDCKLSSYF